uniref:HalB n=1 Tax=Rhodobacteraceae bacterium QY30 TaxID=2033435 RepID=UPI003CDF86E0
SGSIEALMLFGSAARGESDKNSAVALLAVTSGVRPFSKKTEQTELQFLNPEELLRSASDGDLFAIHLAFEGKIIFDTTGVFTRFKERLVIRKDYGREIKWGNDLAWYLLDFGMNAENTTLVNKRIAWCVRTIAIARLVESGKIIFSPRALAKEFPRKHVSDLIGLRRSDEDSQTRKRRLAGFLDSIDSSRPSVSSEQEYVSHFERTENRVGLQTLHGLKKKNGNEESPY